MLWRVFTIEADIRITAVQLSFEGYKLSKIGNALESRFSEILEEFGLENAVESLVARFQPGIRISRVGIDTGNWPPLFQQISAQLRAHHEKQGSGGHVRKRKPILEREKIVVPDGPLSLQAGVTYCDVCEYLCREVLPESVMPYGTSRLGGQPDLPIDQHWPTWDNPGKHGMEPEKNKKLTFLGQFNLAELQEQAATGELPADGMLYIFYDSTTEPWGYDPADIPAHRIIYAPAGQKLVRHVCPDAENLLLPATVTFSPTITFPGLDESVIDWAAVGIRVDDIDWYELEEALLELRPTRPRHHLLGTPYQIQQGSMAAESQLVTNGFFAGDEEGWRRGMSTPGIAEGIDKWRLLLQFDSEDTDDGLGPMWGDCGMLYFWIEKDRLAAKDFSNTCAILQCS